MALEAFTASQPLTLGVELELQLLDTHDFDLTPRAEDLLRELTEHTGQWDVKPEITRSMIEIGTSIQRSFAPLRDELHDLRTQMSRAARKLNIAISGGGTHAYQHWSAQRIFPTERFHYISELYGYLAKQFTVFGQHVHVGVPNGDDALWLLHALSRYVPHFIALAASSPYVQGEDTGFQSARLNSVFAFPLSGRAPFVLTWDGFGQFFDKMTSTGVVQSMKDFYWDIRPKPEYGTIEIRVCDTPLTVRRAALLAAYAQSLAAWHLEERPLEPSRNTYVVNSYNRFEACRYGFRGTMVDPYVSRKTAIGEDILQTVAKLAPHAARLGCGELIEELSAGVRTGASDAAWLRGRHAARGSLADVVREACARWETS